MSCRCWNAQATYRAPTHLQNTHGCLHLEFFCRLKASYGLVIVDRLIEVNQYAMNNKRVGNLKIKCWLLELTLFNKSNNSSLYRQDE